MCQIGIGPSKTVPFWLPRTLKSRDPQRKTNPWDLVKSGSCLSTGHVHLARLEPGIINLADWVGGFPKSEGSALKGTPPNHPRAFEFWFKIIPSSPKSRAESLHSRSEPVTNARMVRPMQKRRDFSERTNFTTLPD